MTSDSENKMTEISEFANKIKLEDNKANKIKLELMISTIKYYGWTMGGTKQIRLFVYISEKLQIKPLSGKMRINKFVAVYKDCWIKFIKFFVYMFSENNIAVIKLFFQVDKG